MSGRSPCPDRAGKSTCVPFLSRRSMLGVKKITWRGFVLTRAGHCGDRCYMHTVASFSLTLFTAAAALGCWGSGWRWWLYFVSCAFWPCYNYIRSVARDEEEEEARTHSTRPFCFFLNYTRAGLKTSATVLRWKPGR